MGGKVTNSVRGQAVSDGRLKKNQPLIFSADEAVEVSLDNHIPVAAEIDIGRDEMRFTTKIKKITIDGSDPY